MELVIVLEVDPDRLVEFAATIGVCLDLWVALGQVGPEAGWALYPTVLTGIEAFL